MNDNWPVIVGVGEIVDRPEDPRAALEPLALMSEALLGAERDAGRRVLSKLDSLDIVHQITWRYDGTAARLCERLGIASRRAVYGITGGETPIRYLHEAALRIWRGESEVAAICGAEAQHALARAKGAGIELPWTPPAGFVEHPMRREDRLRPIAIRHGMVLPVQIYPLYENATLAAWGQTPAQAQAESAKLYSRFAAVAAANEYAWSRKPYTPNEIATPAPDNRLIAFPYTKRMVANPAVNQGAAVIVMSAARAKALGIRSAGWIYVWGGAAANEPRDYLARDQYVRSDAQETVLQAAERVAARSNATLGATELYSCFPCVPKMARRTLHLSEDSTPTVTGGLSLFGAPLNDYMTHATCAMVRTLRSGNADAGLLYGQGEYVTKHHALVVGRRPADVPLDDAYDLQAQADAKRGTVPMLAEDYEGPATIETHTTIYDRDGHPEFGTVLGLTSGGTRVMARVPKDDSSTLAALTDLGRSPVGLSGRVIRSADGLLRFAL
jgi:acetyl-CoA C-acetyltransferase